MLGAQNPPLRPLAACPHAAASITTIRASGHRSRALSAVQSPVKPPPTMARSACTSPVNGGSFGPAVMSSNQTGCRAAPSKRAAREVGSGMFATTGFQKPVIGIGIPPVMTYRLVIEDHHLGTAEGIKAHPPQFAPKAACLPAAKGQGVVVDQGVVDPDHPRLQPFGGLMRLGQIGRENRRTQPEARGIRTVERGLEIR